MIIDMCLIKYGTQLAEVPKSQASHDSSTSAVAPDTTTHK
jgi:hypothetical protein